MAGNTNFPGSPDSHTGGDPFGFAEVANLKYTTATVAHTSSVTTVTVTSTTGFASRGIIIVGLEAITYTGKTSTTFTGCTRGTGGTTAAAFNSGAIVGSAPVAANLNDHSAAIVAMQNELILRRQPELLINGNYDVWQRGTSARTATTTYSTDTSYAADRMFTLPVGASVTVQQSTTVPDTNSLYSALITGASSVTTVDHGQRIRAGVVNTNCRRSLVFSAYVRNVSGASFTPTLRIGTPGGADDFTTVTNRLAQTLQACPDSAWTRVYHVFDPSAYTNLANGMEVVLRVPSGSLVSGDTVYISQFDLRPGIALAPFTPPDPDTELLRCLRYYFKTFPQAVAPAQNTGNANGALAYVTQVGGTTAGNGAMLRYPVIMRSSPTVTFFNISASNTKWRNVSIGADSATPVTVGPNETGVLVTNAQVAGDLVSNQIMVHLTADAEL